MSKMRGSAERFLSEVLEENPFLVFFSCRGCLPSLDLGHMTSMPTSVVISPGLTLPGLLLEIMMGLLG